MPIKVEDPFTLLVWTQVGAAGTDIMAIDRSPRIGPLVRSAAYHQRCVHPYPDIGTAGYIVENYDVYLYREDEFLPPCFTRCSRCEGEFPRPPKRRR